MTLEELHSRILLHELRAILFDDSRGGTAVPAGYRELIEQSPHEPASYLVLADHFDDDGDVLGELIRIQVELIGLLPPDLFLPLLESDKNQKRKHPSVRQHPFFVDFALNARKENPKEPSRLNQILAERSHIVIAELFSETEYETHETIGGETAEFPVRKVTRHGYLGRTTRMLTDVIRWCFMNHGKNVLVRMKRGEPWTRERFGELLEIITGKGHEPSITPFASQVFDSWVHLSESYFPSVWPYGDELGTPDATFTDHAYREPPPTRYITGLNGYITSEPASLPQAEDEEL